MKLNNRFIFGILSLLLAAVIAFVALPTIARQTNGKEEIVRITQPVLKGEQISSENAEVVEVGGYNLPSNIAHQLSDVNGLYATADLAVGDYILNRIFQDIDRDCRQCEFEALSPEEQLAELKRAEESRQAWRQYIASLKEMINPSAAQE